MKYLLALLLATSCQAAALVKFAWEQPDDPGWVVAGYNVYIFTEAVQQTTNPALNTNYVIMITTTETNASWTIPVAGVRHWAYATAFDPNRIESEMSEPVVFWQPSKPRVRILPRLQTSQGLTSDWKDAAILPETRIDATNEVAFWRIKATVEPIDIEYQ